MKENILALACVLFAAMCLFPHNASAHEVYVLSPTQVQADISTPGVPLVETVEANLGQFSFWVILGLVLFIFILLVSMFRPLEKRLAGFFMRLKPFAPLVSRVTVGLSFIAAAYFAASYGPELPLVSVYGSFTPIIQAALYVVGVLIIFGLFTRPAAFVALCLFGIAVYEYGTYMFTYLNYLGEIILLLIAGAGFYAVHKPQMTKIRHEKIEKIGFFVLRVCFGFALIFASAYAKFIHSHLAVDTVTRYHLTNYLHFPVNFLVLGAGLVEMTIGLCFILGIEIRFMAIFLNFWLILSLLFFGEVVWPHIILIGIPIAFFCYGYDEYSITGFVLKRFGRSAFEPIL